MLGKEEYLPYGSPINHFEKYFEKFIQSRLKNEKEFIVDFLKELKPEQVDAIISKYKGSSHKVQKLIKDIEDMPYYVSDRTKPIFDDFENTSRKLSKGELILFFIQEKNKYEKQIINQFALIQTERYIDSILTKIKYEISRNTILLREELRGKKYPDATDVLSAYLVLSKNNADVIFENSQIIYDNQLKFNLEAQIDDWYINDGNDPYFPNVDIDNNGKVQIGMVDIKDLKKNLLSFDFPTASFDQKNLWKNKFVLKDKDGKKRQDTIITCLKDLFQHFDKSFPRKGVEIFYHSIIQYTIVHHSNNERKLVRSKINRTFIEKDNSVRIFLALINSLYLAEVIKLGNLYEVLNEYLKKEVGFSEGVFNDLAYHTREANENYLSYKQIIDSILPLEIKKEAARKRNLKFKI